MKITELRDKDRIAAYLQQNLYLNIYQIGDLDDYYWPDTRWWALVENAKIEALALLYTGLSVPTLLLLADDNREQCAELLNSLLPTLPPEIYVHYTEGLGEIPARRYDLRSYGLCLKLGLTAPDLIDKCATSNVVQLDVNNENELQELYQIASPGNWFNRRMLATELYYGVRHEEKLVSVAGVHVVSREYGVAALGNIATHPDWRGQGLATETTARVCQQLLSYGCRIGLNVVADNAAAVKCYMRLGFTEAGRYTEAQATAHT